MSLQYKRLEFLLFVILFFVYMYMYVWPDYSETSKEDNKCNLYLSLRVAHWSKLIDWYREEFISSF
jgi:hypothetical protein